MSISSEVDSFPSTDASTKTAQWSPAKTNMLQQLITM